MIWEATSQKIPAIPPLNRCGPGSSLLSVMTEYRAMLYDRNAVNYPGAMIAMIAMKDMLYGQVYASMTHLHSRSRYC